MNVTLDDPSGSEQSDSPAPSSAVEPLTLQPGQLGKFGDGKSPRRGSIHSRPGGLSGRDAKRTVFCLFRICSAGVCIHAAHFSPPTILAMQQDPSFRGNSLMVNAATQDAPPGLNYLFFKSFMAQKPRSKKR